MSDNAAVNDDEGATPDPSGQFMRYMPITVISCLLASLAMALILIPVIGKLVTKRFSVMHKRETT